MAMPFTVRSAPGDDPRVQYWEVISPYRSAVEMEICRLQWAHGVEASEFRRPWLELNADGHTRQWVSVGFTRTREVDE
jgi:hypothetical protein